MRFCSFQANSRAHTWLCLFKQRMFLVAMPTDASSAIKKHHIFPLFHEFTQNFTLPKVFLYFSLHISLWLQINWFHRPEHAGGQEKSKACRFQAAQGKTLLWVFLEYLKSSPCFWRAFKLVQLFLFFQNSGVTAKLRGSLSNVNTPQTQQAVANLLNCAVPWSCT